MDEEGDKRLYVPTNSATCHRVLHQCVPIAASRARLRGLSCYVIVTVVWKGHEPHRALAAPPTDAAVPSAAPRPARRCIPSGASLLAAAVLVRRPKHAGQQPCGRIPRWAHAACHRLCGLRRSQDACLVATTGRTVRRTTRRYAEPRSVPRRAFDRKGGRQPERWRRGLPSGEWLAGDEMAARLQPA